MQDYVEILPEREHKFSIIWLHGLGADGHDFESIVPELRLDPVIHYIFPHAPIIPVTINGGVEMRAWYDIKGMNLKERAEINGIRNSITIVNSLIDMEKKAGIPASNIILAGFSQGGVIVLHTALNSNECFAGVLALSTYLPFEDQLKPGENIKKTPFFMAHGMFDPVVPFEYGKQALEFIKSEGFTVQWREYPMQHEVNLNEINDISQFISNILKSS